MSISAPSPPIFIPDDNELALPAPLTSRNLQPRSRAVSLARSTHSGSLSRPASRTSSRSHNMSTSTRHRSDSLSSAEESLFIQALMQPDTGEGSSSSHASRMAGGKRRQTGDDVLRRSKRRRISFVDWMVSSGEDEDDEAVDQLISDDEDEKPLPSTSTSIAGPSTQGTLFSSQASSSLSSPPGYVSSPSLAKILHATDIEPQPIKSLHEPSTSTSTSTIPPVPVPVAPSPAPEKQPEPLSEYTCPICFFPPTNATLTPCGHICCGACLFTAVKTTMHRGAMMPTGEPNVARCPVCRAEIKGWDGRGGGVIGIKARAIFSI
ncbi:uncharacterized protein LACBIDRAFT_330927 [Laccaria bicolor S238N-H82]|uniref:Predicted protein n=1 Tax=Laccaria bicolor (strain S238N-H82 / ATCC MYA-4686) TaxID=486041 RepID=B0DMP8_LACBS|nr:uncharacterized protein LACBIDRAFT_330927 [Laccaria bicolor S238N-H82]EDR04092.1 predicted protein [Laccaria bicolor S238N-H82]|eukprot:XP_001885347.1 predicted protein [Laccaria bicolor S238N-H82]